MANKEETQTKLETEETLDQGLAQTRDNILDSETDKCFASVGLIDACENNPIIKRLATAEWQI